MAESKKVMTIPIISTEQEEELRTYCSVNNWDYKIEEESAKCATDDKLLKVTTKRKSKPSKSQDIPTQKRAKEKSAYCAAVERTSNARQSCESGDHDHEDVAALANEGECPYCLCSPCITTYPQAWLGQGQPPRAGNNTIRKTLYKHFWKVLDRAGLWRDRRYLDRKEYLLEMYKRAHEDDEAIVKVGTVREVMPECVLTKVRNMYPNPKKKPYMGHKWN